jgi:acetoacetyl-CoA synthetase
VADRSAEPGLIWEPSSAAIAETEITRYFQWLGRRGVTAKDYWEGWRWSIQHLPDFWDSIWDYFSVHGHRGSGPVMSGSHMPDIRWFPGASVNYAQHLLLGKPDDLAVIGTGEDGSERRLTYRQLGDRVGAAQRGLVECGVERGDVVVALMPNTVETLVMFIACAGLGATWSSCSPEFGLRSVVDRFGQLGPKVLLAVASYNYGGKTFDKTRDIAELRQAIPGLSHALILGESSWDVLDGLPITPTFEAVAFEHPLWVLYSSGTTGLPKGIVHSHGGVLLEQLKQVRLHMDVGPTDVFFWYTTTSWMMWNVVVSSLLAGATAVLYDGSSAHPDLGALWRLAERTGITYMGISAGFAQACLKDRVRPREDCDLSEIRTIGVTGSPLTPEGFDWLAGEVKPGIPIASMSGGTDVCSSFISATRILPVHRGELQCPALGVWARAYDSEGRPVVGKMGELVVTTPMPSMPVSLWGDSEGRKYRETYFSMYPGVWRHGDWVTFNARGGAVIHGRSDATLNRGGVRMGSSEFYRVVEAMPEIADSLVVEIGDSATTMEIVLFVVLTPGLAFDEELRGRMRAAIRRNLSPRHVPDHLEAVSAIPRTLNGKKLELPIKRLLAGDDIDRVVSRGSVANPDALEAFIGYRDRIGRAT